MKKLTCERAVLRRVCVCHSLVLRQVVMAMYTSKDDAQRKQINAFMTTFQVMLWV